MKNAVKELGSQIGLIKSDSPEAANSARTIAAAAAILDPRVGADVSGSGARLAAGSVAMATAASAPGAEPRSAWPGAASNGSAEPGPAMLTAERGGGLR